MFESVNKRIWVNSSTTKPGIQEIRLSLSWICINQIWSNLIFVIRRGRIVRKKILKKPAYAFPTHLPMRLAELKKSAEVAATSGLESSDGLSVRGTVEA